MAVPFPCSKTKSEISFSHGWAQAVLSLLLTSQRMPAATDACICVYNCKTKQFYECERNNFCINTYTPHVAATSFFAGEVEIFDFVTERVKRCIAAMIL